MGKSPIVDMIQGSDGAFEPVGSNADLGLGCVVAEAMPTGKLKEAPGPLTTPTIDYNEVPTPKLCSANSCKNGHEWQPVIQLARCPGCGSPLLAVKMLNCPICNEPVEAIRLRSDHLPQGGAIMPMCRGSQSLAEVQVIEMKRNAAALEEANHVEREMISKP